jgi:hypothetical protein
VHADTDALDALVAEMAVSLAFLVNTLDLTHVFLEGIFATDFERNAATVARYMEKFWSYPGIPNCTILRASGGEHALSQSAAAVAQDDYYGRTAVPASVPAATYETDI